MGINAERAMQVKWLAACDRADGVDLDSDEGRQHYYDLSDLADMMISLDTTEEEEEEETATTTEDEKEEAEVDCRCDDGIISNL